jgi:L-alanine-DL-glutamate epimerase-like enolase superfamily enzyme
LVRWCESGDVFAPNSETHRFIIFKGKGMMKITNIRPILLRDVYEESERWFFPGGRSTGWNAALLEIQTETGLIGLGESIAGSTAPTAFVGMVKQMEALLIGADALDREGLTARIRKAGVYWATAGMGAGVLSAIDIALWDIAGKDAGVPVYELLGGATRTSIPLYVSGGFSQSPASFEAEMEKWIEAGFRSVKIRAFGSPSEVIATVGLARSILGDEIELMVDLAANFLPEPYDVSAALEVALGIERMNVAFLEEPLPSYDIQGYTTLVRASPVQIAGGESVSSREQFELLFQARAIDLAQPDPTHCGGISAVRDIARMALKHTVRVAPHTWGSGVSLMASLHLSAAVGSLEICEYCGVANRLQTGLLETPIHMEDGYVRLPKETGLGVRLTSEIESRYGQTDTAFAPTY